MKANPEKIQLIFFDKHKSYDAESIKINNMIIKHQPTVKLLGVHIDSKLTFNVHVSEICRKAGYKLNALSRLSKTLDVESKTLLLNSFILSFFNYCCIIWHFCDIQNTKSIEKIQKRALRFVYNDFISPYEDLRNKSCKPLVYVQRLRSILVEVYKSVNNIGPLYMHNMFKSKDTSYHMRNSNRLNLSKFSSVQYGFNSFSYQGAKLWNSLSNDIKNANYNMFKSHISNWYPTICHCSTCIVCKLNTM